MAKGTNGKRPDDYIVDKHVTGKIGPRKPPADPPSGGTAEDKPGCLKKLFGAAALILIALGSAVLGIAGVVDIFGGAA